MSASTDLVLLREKIEELEAELDRLRIDFDFSVDQTQEYRDQYNELQARYVELKVDNRRLTRKLNEPNAPSPAIASQSDEVAPLKQQLAEKDQVIAAQDEKYQTLVNSIKPIFNTLFAVSSMLNKEAIQSCLVAMPKDTAKTLGALQNEKAQAGPPSDGDAESKTLVTQGVTKTPSEVTKTPSERSASRSERPDPGKQPESSIQGPASFSGVVTSKRAEGPRRARAGQAKVPVSHEVLARQEAHRAEKREEIQSSAGRSQKPNKVTGFQPPQKVAGSSNITAPPVPEQNVTDWWVSHEFLSRSFVFEPERPSSPVPKEKVVPVPPPSTQGSQASASREQTPTGPATQTDLGKITTPAPPTVTNPQIRGKSNDLKDFRPQVSPNASLSEESEQSSHQVSSVGPLDSRQAQDANSLPPAPPQEVQPQKFSSDFGEDDEEAYVKTPTGSYHLF